jgi:hypothetical protein
VGVVGRTNDADENAATVLEQMEDDDILKSLSPPKRRELLRRLNADSAK